MTNSTGKQTRCLWSIHRLFPLWACLINVPDSGSATLCIGRCPCFLPEVHYSFLFISSCVCLHLRACMQGRKKPTYMNVFSFVYSYRVFCKPEPRNLLIRLKLGLSHPFCNSVSLLIIFGIIIPIELHACMCVRARACLCASISSLKGRINTRFLNRTRIIHELSRRILNHIMHK